MANKTYTVMKDGEELKELKTLVAAKKLADAEGAEVFSDGKCIYQGGTEAVEELIEETVADDAAETEPVMEPEKKGNAPAQYRLKALMNVRMSPNGRIMKTLPAGTDVEVISIDSDWLHLSDGTYILYQDGEFAEKL